jgi:hypothetical protein
MGFYGTLKHIFYKVSVGVIFVYLFLRTGFSFYSWRFISVILKSVFFSGLKTLILLYTSVIDLVYWGLLVVGLVLLFSLGYRNRLLRNRE